MVNLGVCGVDVLVVLEFDWFSAIFYGNFGRFGDCRLRQLMSVGILRYILPNSIGLFVFPGG